MPDGIDCLQSIPAGIRQAIARQGSHKRHEAT
nr:MAG TPA: hypothetical protein [Inoviridae sp.]